MSDKKINITRRKVLAGVGAVGAAGAAAGYGTSALFSDTESFESNTIAAGELDLKVDWQQRYFGPRDDDFPAYGSAGYPWVNAHPDEGSSSDPDDPNGIQSLDSDEYGSVPDDGYVTYEDRDANIQEYLTCETLDHDYGFGPGRDSLVELEDVKPGDVGEITFSFHLCDNPGYVWLQGGNLETAENGVTEPEAQSDAEEETEPRDPSGDSDDDVVELADLIEVRAWYDLNCNNEFDTDEELVDPVFEWGTLRDVVDSLSSKPAMLNPVQYASTTDSISVPGESDCLPLGKIEGWQSDRDEDDVSASDIVVADARRTAIGTDTEYDTSGQRVDVLEPGNDGNESGTLELIFRLENTDTGNQTFVRISNIQDKDGDTAMVADPLDIGEPIEFDFDTLREYDGESSDNRGICQVDLKAGTEEKQYDTRDGGACAISEDGLNTDEIGKGVSHVFFYYCPETSGEASGTPDRCFPGRETYCVGFEWRLPERVGNEVQSDSVSFDLGFYAEQCRNNDG